MAASGMISAPKVSVLMCVYNGSLYLQEAIDSILGQTFGDFEFVIVDDGSEDQTPTILDRCLDHRIVRVRNDCNAGLTRSLNIGLAFCHGEYVARQDADDISLPDRFRQQVSFLEHHMDTAVVGCAYTQVYVDGRPEQIIEMPLDSETIRDQLWYSHAFCHGSVMMRRASLEDVGGYDERFQTAQDRDLWLRIAERYSLANLPSNLYRLRIHDRSVTGSKRLDQRLAAQQAVLGALERCVMRPAPVALGRFYWRAALDAMAANDSIGASAYVEKAARANRRINEDCDYLLETSVNRAFEVSWISVAGGGSVINANIGLSLLERLFVLCPTNMHQLRRHCRWAIAELHAAYAFAAFRRQNNQAVVRHCLHAWAFSWRHVKNGGLWSIFFSGGVTVLLRSWFNWTR